MPSAPVAWIPNNDFHPFSLLKFLTCWSGLVARSFVLTLSISSVVPAALTAPIQTELILVYTGRLLTVYLEYTRRLLVVYWKITNCILGVY